MDRPMLTAGLVGLLVGVVATGGGALALSSRAKSNRHDADIEGERTMAVAAAASAGRDAVTAALAPALVEVRGLAEIARAVPPFCQPGQEYDEAACMAHAVCTRAGLGAGEAVGCDRALNAWESERRIEVVEAGGADAVRRDERRRDYERRK